MADSNWRYSPDDDDGEEEYPLRERLHGGAAEFMEFDEEVQEVVVLGEGRTPETNRPRCSAPRNKEFPQPSEACWSDSALEEVDGLLCPICFHGWSDGGDHAICCLPCGHIFGMSCIKRWLQQQKKSGKDFDNEAKWDRAMKACMSRQAELENKLDALEEKTSNFERLFKDAISHPSGLTASCSTCNKQPNDDSSCQLELQTSLVKPLEAEDIALPSGTKAVKDLHVSPFDGKLILYAS